MCLLAFNVCQTRMTHLTYKIWQWSIQRRLLTSGVLSFKVEWPEIKKVTKILTRAHESMKVIKEHSISQTKNKEHTYYYKFSSLVIFGTAVVLIVVMTKSILIYPFQVFVKNQFVSNITFYSISLSGAWQVEKWYVYTGKITIVGLLFWITVVWILNIGKIFKIFPNR